MSGALLLLPIHGRARKGFSGLAGRGLKVSNPSVGVGSTQFHPPPGRGIYKWVYCDITNQIMATAATEIPLRDLMEAVGADPARFESSLEARIVFQKTMYLLEARGLLEPKAHDFGLYIHGPYSSIWARRGYAAARGDDIKVRLKGTPAGIRKLLGPADPWRLAALATAHFLKRQGRKDPEIAAFFEAQKPGLKGYLPQAMAWLRAHGE